MALDVRDHVHTGDKMTCCLSGQGRIPQSRFIARRYLLLNLESRILKTMDIYMLPAPLKAFSHGVWG